MSDKIIFDIIFWIRFSSRATDSMMDNIRVSSVLYAVRNPMQNGTRYRLRAQKNADNSVFIFISMK